MEAAIEIVVIATFFAVVILSGLTLWRWRQEDYAEAEAEMSQSWTCEYCGTVVEATTIENLIDGYRIHNEAIYCPGDEDDDPQYYNDQND